MVVVKLRGHIEARFIREGDAVPVSTSMSVRGVEATLGHRGAMAAERAARVALDAQGRGPRDAVLLMLISYLARTHRSIFATRWREERKEAGRGRECDDRWHWAEGVGAI